MIVPSSLTFFVNGKKFVLDKGADPSETISSFLRRNGITSSKIGCFEGVCGSCAVCIGRWDPKQRKARFYSVNACLTPLYLVQHCSVLTSEGIGTPSAMHPVQERLARGHGSQCGYCSPGFVMAMYSLLRNDPCPSDYDIQQSIRGNICRCTGYRPIVEAFSTFGSAGGGCTGAKNGKCCMQQERQGDEEEESILESKLVKWADFPKYDPTQEIIFPPELIKIISETPSVSFPIFEGNNLHVILPNSLSQLSEINPEKLCFKSVKTVSSGILALQDRNKEAMSKPETWISLQNCRQTQVVEVDGDKLILGASLSLTKVRDAIAHLAGDKFEQVVWFMDQFSSNHVRNNATWAGSLLSGFGDFPTLALALGMKLHFYDVDKKQTEIHQVNNLFFHNVGGLINNNNNKQKILVSGVLDLNNWAEIKTAKLDLNVLSMATVVHSLSSNGVSTVAVNGIGAFPVSFKCADPKELLKMDKLKNHSNSEYLELLLAKLDTHKSMQATPFESLQMYKPPVNNNNQEYWAVGRPLAHQYADRHVTGEGLFSGDVQLAGMYHLAPVMSSVPHAEIISIDASKALHVPGVVDFVSVKDVPASNLPGYGPINMLSDDTEVFAEKKALYVGHIVGGIVAETPLIARQAAKLVQIQYKELDPVLTIEDAIRTNSFYTPEPLKLSVGANVDDVFKNCAHVVEGTVHLDGQQHVYLEPQSAVAVPQEGNEWTIYSATQAASSAQIGAAAILGLPTNKIVVKVKRIGGAFGGKCMGQSGYALYPAVVAANKLKKPVSCVLTRKEDFTITGGRHPASCHYKLGCDVDGRLLAGKFTIHTVAGYSLDHSVWVAQALMQTFDACYKVPNLDATVYVCKTNTPSNTAMRGFGQPQSYFFIEHAMDRLARKIGMLPEDFRQLNFSKEGDTKAIGEEIIFDNLRLCWDKCREFAQVDELRKEFAEFNRNSVDVKRGLAMSPTRFGLMHAKPFEQTFVLAQIYLDGSVELSIGGVDMGQGLNIKVLQVASNELNLSMDKITIRDNSTDKTANAPVTGGSQGSDVHGHAVRSVCQKLMRTLRPLMEANPKMSWEEIVMLAYGQALPLSAGEHCNYPREKDGTAYHTTGAACAVLEVNTKTGEHLIKSVQIVMDTGHSLNPAVDIGQIEGAFTQMYGHLTMESVVTDTKTGRVINDNLNKYKLPRARNVPEKFHVLLLNKPNHSFGAVYSSKATGEPPLMMGASTYFAIKDALLSVNPDAAKDDAKTVNILNPPLLPLTITKAVKNMS